MTTGQAASFLVFLNIVGTMVSLILSLVLWSWRWLWLEVGILMGSLSAVIIFAGMDSL